MQKLLVICGPTAVGKTGLALQLARHWGGELVSADSRQIYRFMDIGTGKDLNEKKPIPGMTLKIDFENISYKVIPYSEQGIPVWLYDIVNPDEDFSAAHYQKISGAVIQNIYARGKLPVAVGGTGLYIRAITEGIDTVMIPPDHKLRQQLQDYPIQKLQSLVKEKYPDAWSELNPSDRHNPRRLIRKIEIFMYSDVNDGKIKINAASRDVLKIGLELPRHELYRRIDQRVDDRVKRGRHPGSRGDGEKRLRMGSEVHERLRVSGVAAVVCSAG
jgi:tRNA dimethylallyltransferase